MNQADGLSEKLLNAAMEYLKNGRWFDWIHTQISLDFARRLCTEVGADPKVVLPAVILHDIGYYFYSDVENLEILTTMPNIPPFSQDIKEGHLLKGAELAREILNGVGYDYKVEEIVWIVRNHEDTDDRKRFLNLNQAVVSDADSLFRVTDVGVRQASEAYKLREEEIVKKMLELKDRWFITNEAKTIADEELKKLRAYWILEGFWR